MRNPMGAVTTRDGTEIFYKDWGTGEARFFYHRWPLSADDGDAQIMFLLAKGYRVIAHDRRGRGRSTQTAAGYDIDTYADDAHEVVKKPVLISSIRRSSSRPKRIPTASQGTSSIAFGTVQQTTGSNATKTSRCRSTRCRSTDSMAWRKNSEGIRDNWRGHGMMGSIQAH